MKSTMKVGEKYGRLIVRELLPKYMARVECECGSIAIKRRKQLKNGQTKSCGCYQREKAALTHSKHSMSRSCEYRTWVRIRVRCNNPNSPDYPKYGARGIAVCDEWNLSFDAFFRDMGPRPDGCSIERKDVNGDYSPGNCIWATALEKTRNRRNSIRVVFNGTETTLQEISDEHGISYRTVYGRFKAGLPLIAERAA